MLRTQSDLLLRNDAMISIELRIEEMGGGNKSMNSITDFLYVVILNDEQESSWRHLMTGWNNLQWWFPWWKPDKPVSTKQYLAPIGTRNESEIVVIEDVLTTLDRYYVWFVNRGELLYKVDGQISIKNSFGHLDVDSRYFPLYGQLGFFWHLTVLLIWCNLLWMKREYVVTVHMLAGGYIFIRVVEKLMTWIYVEKVNRTGWPVPAEALKITTSKDLLEVLGLLSMLMFASGYQMRHLVNERKVKLLVWTAFCYVITCIAQSFCYMLSSICSLIWLMRFIFRASLVLGVIWLINASSSIIKSELHSESFVETTKLKYLELTMLKAVRAGFLAYVCAPFVLSSMHSFLRSQDWSRGSQDFSILVLLKDVLLLPLIEGFILYHVRPSEHITFRNM